MEEPSEDFKRALKQVLADPNMQVTMRALELYDTGLSIKESVLKARLEMEFLENV